MGNVRQNWMIISQKTNKQNPLENGEFFLTVVKDYSKLKHYPEKKNTNPILLIASNIHLMKRVTHARLLLRGVRGKQTYSASRRGCFHILIIKKDTEMQNWPKRKIKSIQEHHERYLRMAMKSASKVRKAIERENYYLSSSTRGSVEKGCTTELLLLHCDNFGGGVTDSTTRFHIICFTEHLFAGKTLPFLGLCHGSVFPLTISSVFFAFLSFSMFCIGFPKFSLSSFCLCGFRTNFLRGKGRVE